MTPSTNDITGMLADWGAGDRDATDHLVSLLYTELRRIAHRQLRFEHPGHTLNTTALVHEAYARLADQTRMRWKNRGHFFAVAVGAMRRILVDHARKRQAFKRGAGAVMVTLDAEVPGGDIQADELVAIDEALSRLAAIDERLSRVVECRFFGGLSEEETAAALGITSRTVRRDWIKAKGWLYRELRS
jgi:RNA polymerase sigma factor (TIGR02999 family)